MPITDPTDIANCRWWLDADDASTFTFWSTTLVNTWADKSGNGTTFRDFTVGVNPPNRNGTQNGLTTVVCNTVGFGGEDAGISETQPISMFIVAKVTATTWSGVFRGGGSFGSNCQIRRSGADSSKILFRAGGSEQSMAIDNTNYHLIGGIFNGASSSQRLDKSSITTANVGTQGLNQMVLAMDGDSNRNGIEYAEVVVYESAISGTDLTDIEDYLYDKWFGAAPDPDLAIPELTPYDQANVYRM